MRFDVIVGIQVFVEREMKKKKNQEGQGIA